MEQAQLRGQIEDVISKISQEKINLKQFESELDKLVKAHEKTSALYKKFREETENRSAQLSRILDVKDGGKITGQIFSSLKNDLLGTNSESALESIRETAAKLVLLITQTDDKIDDTRLRISELECDFNYLTQCLNELIAAEGNV